VTSFLSHTPWWKKAVIYHVYLRSFADGNGDGIGDIAGLRSKLRYFTPDSLNVDAIWLSPLHPSPNADWGYDVSDYLSIHPDYGTLAEFDKLIHEAKAQNLRILLDFVPNHTSIMHPWFREAVADPTSPKRDWYFFRQPLPDGRPPNNWTCKFGGSVWNPAENAPDKVFYLSSYLPEQADLNWRNPEVQTNMCKVLDFWLSRGIAGFRIDAAYRLMKDPDLQDNPLHPEHTENNSPTYTEQIHLHDENHPDIPKALAMLQSTSTHFQGVLLGEVFAHNQEQYALYYGTTDTPLFDLVFDFHLADAPWDATAFKDVLKNSAKIFPTHGWPAWALSNHDRSRHASRYDPNDDYPERTIAAAFISMTLRGTPILYMGEEIGMRDVPIPPPKIQDPLTFQVPGMGRDMARTPMRWHSWKENEGTGFTTGTPWLPEGDAQETRDVESQRTNPSSLFHTYRKLLMLRKSRYSLQTGNLSLVDSSSDILAYTRTLRKEHTHIAVNMGTTTLPLPQVFSSGTVLLSSDESLPTGTIAPQILRAGDAIILAQ